ncbi:MAG: hypothetical protein LBR85_08815 [Oscillospiraceae bacterium]|jgi:hypothetical protein|nr:hypothetical protein [Oscillospiraceae bacterium]
MAKRLFTICAALALFSACSIPQRDDLLRPPKPPPGYSGLAELLSDTLDAGAVYAPPARGDTRQSIQMVDLDSDGQDEALAFFRFSEGPLLRIFVYALSDGVYARVTGIDVSGDSIDSITYRDMNGDGLTEAIVAYRLGSIKALSVYSYYDRLMTQIYTAECSSYYLADLTGDGFPNLVLVSVDPVGTTGSVRLLRYRNSALEEQGEAPLSTGISALARISSGALNDGKQALFVTSTLADGTTASLTDIFVFKDDRIENITIDPETNTSHGTLCMQSVYPLDINGDSESVIDVPFTVELPRADPLDEMADLVYTVSWYRYASNGARSLTLTTYHTRQAAWYWVIPQSWADRLTISLVESSPRERATTLSFYGGEDGPHDTVVTFYTATLAQGETFSPGDRILLFQNESTAVTAVIGDGHQADITEGVLRENFHLKPSEWRPGVLT